MGENCLSDRLLFHIIFDADVIGAKFDYVALFFLVGQRAENIFIGKLRNGVVDALSSAFEFVEFDVDCLLFGRNVFWRAQFIFVVLVVTQP